ncbi:Na+/H+ antiporter subunit A, partial [Georgenia sp. 10Sc9-8]|nr:Na+/H+ antiporter subunit A [Georgenia halotolerans]
MLQLVILHFVVAMIAPALFARMGRKAFLVLALVPAAAAVWAALQTGAVLSGSSPAQQVAWVPTLGLHLDFRLDALSWLMVLIVGGIGALVLVYSSPYFAAHATALGRFGGVFLAFAGAMLGLVTTDNTLLLYIFWELTTVFSYLLIGHYHDRQASRRAAMQAITITTFGGLAMLAGLIALGEAEGGSYRISELVASAGAGTLGAGGPDVLVPAAIALVLLGAVTKSALIPFHFWLPAAMAAPTPVSAYLHAAAMVKAGVYLVARLAPGLAEEPVWRWTVIALGLGTMLLGGYRSLRQHDLKLLLAFGTVSQLGLITVLVGYGDRGVALAGLALLLAHALFKACLFLTVGVVDWSAGTRDLRELSGLRRRLPAVAIASAVATASMAGLPPLAGYVAKEGALEALVHEGSVTSIVVLLMVALGSALTLAYGLRFWWGAFWDKPGVEEPEVQSPPALFVSSPVVLAALTVVIGLLPGPTEHVLAPYADTYPTGDPGHLTLWGGFGVPLWTTVGVIVLGTLAFVARGPVERTQESLSQVTSASDVYRRLLRRLDNLAADLTAGTQRGSLPFYLSVILVVMAASTGTALLVGDTWPAEVRLWDEPLQLVVGAVIIVAAVLTANARRRLKAVVLMGVAGYGVAVLYELHGAPDLALTQVLVETVTLVVFVLVLRRLPAYFSNRPLPATRWLRATLGAVVGLVVAGIGLAAAGARIHEPVSVDFPEEAYEYGYGRNIVNVTLVDIRAWDTTGEISVLLVAATGVASLVFLRARMGRIDRTSDARGGEVWSGGQPDPADTLRRPRSTDERKRKNPSWLPAGATLAPQRRSVIFEVGTRIIFHTMMVVSVYLLFAGHNAPGGGFAGGLVAGIALAVRYLAGGRYELGDALPIHPGHLLGLGLFLSAGVGALPLLVGGDVLQSAAVDLDLGPLGEMHLV